VAERGVFEDEFTSGTKAEIGNDLERFNPVPKRGKVDQRRRTAARIDVAIEVMVLLDHDPGSRSRATKTHISSRNASG
jgi:hypothetical protein